MNSESTPKWIVGTIIALLAAGGGIVALLNYIDTQKVECPEGQILEIRVGESQLINGFSDVTKFTGVSVDKSLVVISIMEHSQDLGPGNHNLKVNKINYVAIRNKQGNENIAKLKPFKVFPEKGITKICLMK